MFLVEFIPIGFVISLDGRSVGWQPNFDFVKRGL